MILLTQSWREDCRIPLNLSRMQKLVYGLRKRFFKHRMKSRRSFYGFESNIYLLLKNHSILLWRPTFNLKSGVLASATWQRESHDMRSMYIVALMTSGKRSWPQGRLVLKLSINNGNRLWVEFNSVCNHTSDQQNRRTARRESGVLITSIITDWIGRHDVLLLINHNFPQR